LGLRGAPSIDFDGISNIYINIKHQTNVKISDKVIKKGLHNLKTKKYKKWAKI